MSFLGDLVDFVTPSFQMVVHGFILHILFQCNEITYLLHNCFILFVVVVCCWVFFVVFLFFGVVFSCPLPYV